MHKFHDFCYVHRTGELITFCYFYGLRYRLLRLQLLVSRFFLSDATCLLLLIILLLLNRKFYDSGILLNLLGSPQQCTDLFSVHLVLVLTFLEHAVSNVLVFVFILENK